ncbi:unnamed protein product [Lactuca virosa]|uniref:Uncharacterized protein n=1 Tax=Lactuca virosa TaxID=75947 RepID=A0AAU9PA15_9ASTR|nr:unnamed protein product [Lactuca virosa]
MPAPCQSNDLPCLSYLAWVQAGTKKHDLEHYHNCECTLLFQVKCKACLGMKRNMMIPASSGSKVRL